MKKRKNLVLPGIKQRKGQSEVSSDRQDVDMTLPTESLNRAFFYGKRILVTGGTGTVGREIVRQLLECRPEVVRVFSRDETKQYQMEIDFGQRRDLRFLIGDVRDLPRLTMAMREVDLVIHCAALKHVKSCEYNPFEAVKTNILGTQNVILAALEHDSEKVVLSSSDKAVNPSNSMGASKLMAERLMTAANGMRGPRRTIFASVRFGNVIGSRGSVLPLFASQIAAGGPVTVTHPAMTRFIMSLRQAVELLLKAAIMARGGEVFTLRMPSVRIQDLAAAMITGLSKGKPVQIRKVGIKPGEKMYEELLTVEEVQRSEMLDDMYVTYPATSDRWPGDGFGGKRPPRRSYSSRTNGLLDREAVGDFLVREGLLDNWQKAARSDMETRRAS